MEKHQDTYKHKGLRKQLREILKEKGIRNEQVLDAIEALPRHFFLPAEFESHAYEDKAFPIAEGQTISQPYTVAYQSQLLEAAPGSKVLEIGTGSGYQAAVLAYTGVEVYSVERHELLSRGAARTLAEVQMTQGVHLFVGDGTKGLAKHAPYDGIIVTAGAPSVPKALVNQLKTGGKLVIPVGKDARNQKMVRIIKTSDEGFDTEVYEAFSFVPLVGENGWKL